MGGRGSASGISAKGIKYGEEYKTILEYENIKFVEYKIGNATPPWETMSANKNRVYVLVTYFGKLKSIIFYDKEGKRNRQIDLDHQHRKERPHVHQGYEHSPNTVPLSAIDKRYENKVRKIWTAFRNEQ